MICMHNAFKVGYSGANVPPCRLSRRVADLCRRMLHAEPMMKLRNVGDSIT